MSHPLNTFVAGPDGGPMLAFRLGETLHDIAHAEAPNLRNIDGRTWAGHLVAWLDFVDTCCAIAAQDEDPDLRTFVAWLDEDIDRAMAAAERTEGATA